MDMSSLAHFSLKPAAHAIFRFYDSLVPPFRSGQGMDGLSRFLRHCHAPHQSIPRHIRRSDAKRTDRRGEGLWSRIKQSSHPYPPRHLNTTERPHCSDSGHIGCCDTMRGNSLSHTKPQTFENRHFWEDNIPFFWCQHHGATQNWHVMQLVTWRSI